MSEPVRFALPASVTRGRLAAVREALLGILPESEALAVDAASVLEVDGPGVQLLLALEREARSRGVALRIVNRSEALAAALAAHRVEALLP